MHQKTLHLSLLRSVAVILILLTPFASFKGANAANVAAPFDARASDSRASIVARAASAIATPVSTSAGFDHSCMVTSKGGVKCWGANDYGQLGNASLEPALIPVDVPGLDSGVLDVAVGTGHTCALLVTGVVKCWGSNSYGQLGNGSSANSAFPVDVSGLDGGVLLISAFRDHTCALMSSRDVRCWGSNGFGQLGNGSATASSMASNVLGLGGSAVYVSAGDKYSCAVISGGAVKCWGRNLTGQLGNGTRTDSVVPVDVVGLGGGAMTVSAGIYHTCALGNDGGVKCWGSNGQGQLGNGSTMDSDLPVDVLNLTSTVVQVTIGSMHTCVLTSLGGVKCWGQNVRGQLGNGTMMDSDVPVDVGGLGSGVTVVEVGHYHGCAVTIDGKAFCWGANSSGQVGNGSRTDASVPTDVTVFGVLAVSSGDSHTCVLTNLGSVKCWGSNYYGQLGNGSFTDSATPVNVNGLNTGIVAIATGYSHSCVVTSLGGVKCWGNNQDGQLGNGSTSRSAVPVDVIGLSSGVMAVTAGFGHTCALMSNRSVKCWGNDDYGQLGNGLSPASNTPSDVPGLVGVYAIAAGFLHTCVGLYGRVQCWGKNDTGQLGDGTTSASQVPVDSTVAIVDFRSIAGSSFHSCAVSDSAMVGTVRCWGWGGNGRLGNGAAMDAPVPPVDVINVINAKAVSVGEGHSCALTADGKVLCWGGNPWGQLGNGTTMDAAVPGYVLGMDYVVQISSGSRHVCAVTVGSEVRCWGDNRLGQLGDGTTTSSATYRTVKMLWGAKVHVPVLFRANP